MSRWNAGHDRQRELFSDDAEPCEPADDRHTSRYVDTAEGVCPACRSEVPGHVHVSEPAGVYGWTCPKCDTTHDPTDVRLTGEVE